MLLCTPILWSVQTECLCSPLSSPAWSHQPSAHSAGEMYFSNTYTTGKQGGLRTWLVSICECGLVSRYSRVWAPAPADTALGPGLEAAGPECPSRFSACSPGTLLLLLHCHGLPWSHSYFPLALKEPLQFLNPFLSVISSPITHIFMAFSWQWWSILPHGYCLTAATYCRRVRRVAPTDLAPGTEAPKRDHSTFCWHLIAGGFHSFYNSRKESAGPEIWEALGNSITLLETFRLWFYFFFFPSFVFRS